MNSILYSMENNFNFYPIIDVIDSGDIKNRIETGIKNSINDFEACKFIRKSLDACLKSVLYNFDFNNTEHAYNMYKDIYNKILNVLSKIMVFKNDKQNVLCMPFSKYYLDMLEDYFSMFEDDKFQLEETFQEYMENVLYLLSIDQQKFKINEYKSQMNTKFGRADLFVNDDTGNYIIELKKDVISRKSIYQINDYLLGTDIDCKGIIIGRRVLDEDVLKLANKLGIIIYEYDIISKAPISVNFNSVSKKVSFIENMNGLFVFKHNYTFLYEQYLKKVLDKEKDLQHV